MAQATPDVDLSEFEALSKPKRKPCVIAEALEHLTPPECGQLEAAAAKDQGIITNAAIQKWLEPRGIKTTPQAIRSHRVGTCRCDG